MTISSPDHLLTLTEWAALPEDNSRWYELTEGVLVAAPRPGTRHQRLLGEMCGQLHDQLPPGTEASPAIEVYLFPDFPVTVRVPDIAIVPISLVARKASHATAYTLVDGKYELVAESTETLVVDSPVPLKIEVSALLP